MEDLKAIIESLLFVAEKPMSVEKLADIIEEADSKAIRSALEALLDEFNNPGRGFQLHEVAGGFQFRTHPECQAYIRRMLKPAPSRLSRAALETLAIIAYKQPIIRSDIEHIRGVDSGGVLRLLMEKKLVRVLGRREIPGRPLIYATTKHFLEVFDLKNLKDLPTPKEIEELTAQEPDLEEPSEADNPPGIPTPEDVATTAQNKYAADAVAQTDLQAEGREGQASGEETPAAETPAAETPSPATTPGIYAAESGTGIAGEATEGLDEASQEAPGEVTEGPNDAENGATDEATDMALDHGDQDQDNGGKAVGDKGEPAV